MRVILSRYFCDFMSHYCLTDIDYFQYNHIIKHPISKRVESDNEQDQKITIE